MITSTGGKNGSGLPRLEPLMRTAE